MIWNLRMFLSFFGISDTCLGHQILEPLLQTYTDLPKKISKIKNGHNKPDTLRECVTELMQSLPDTEITGVALDDVCKAYEAVLHRPSHGCRKEKMFFDLLSEALGGDKDRQKIVPTDAQIQSIHRTVLSGPQNEAVRDAVDAHLLSKAEYEIIQKHGRFKSYAQIGDAERIRILNRLFIDGEVLSIQDMIARHPQGSFNIIGRGGSGKTHQLINLFFCFISSQQGIIPFYLPLNEIHDFHTANCVISALSDYLEVTSAQFRNILQQNSCNILLLLDGMNEVEGAYQNQVIRAIYEILTRYNSRIVLTSRSDHTPQFNSMGYGSSYCFYKAEVMKLTEEQITQHLSAKGICIDYSALPQSRKRLLDTPQGLQMYVALMEKDRDIEYCDLGSLLRLYSQKILLAEMPLDEQHALEEVIQKIAYYMVKRCRFHIERNEIQALLQDKTYCIHSILDNEHFRKMIVCTDESGDQFEFTHQHFRDFYCALEFNRIIAAIDASSLKSIMDEYFQNDNITTNMEILSLCGNLASSTVLQRVIDCVREQQDALDCNFLLNIIIKIYAIANQNNVSGLNLKNIDLTHVSLSGYQLYTLCRNKNIAFVDLEGSKVSTDTFTQKGLRKASSTICKYRLHDQWYVIAFGTKNALVYDIESNAWSTIENIWEDLKLSGKEITTRDWISCCCVIENDGDPVIYLGLLSGLIIPYRPANLLADGRNVIEPHLLNPDITECGIESIIAIPNSPHIAASNVAGDIFLLDGKLLNDKSDGHTVEEIRNRNESLYKGTTSPCRLTASENTLFYSFGTKIYARPLPLDDRAPFAEWLCVDETILDILYSGGYLFVNIGKNILAYNMEKESIGAAFDPPLDSLDHFTKFSPADREGKALIGTYPSEVRIDSDVENRYVIHKNGLPNYFEIAAEEIFDFDLCGYRAACVVSSLHGYQTEATYSAVCFPRKGYSESCIATTSDDRSVQILFPYDQNAEIIRQKGTYDGIRYIEPISDHELLAAQYDGSVSHWKIVFGDWRCCGVFHIHDRWVWKVKLCQIEQERCFVSCSYDGKLILTSMSTYESHVLLDIAEPIIDFAITEKNGSSAVIYALSNHHVHTVSLELSESKVNFTVSPAVYSKNSLKSIVLMEKDTLFIASVGSDSKCEISMLDKGHFVPDNALNAEEFGYIKGIKLIQHQGKHYLCAYGTGREKNKAPLWKLFSKADGSVWELEVSTAKGGEYETASHAKLNDLSLMVNEEGHLCIPCADTEQTITVFDVTARSVQSFDSDFPVLCLSGFGSYYFCGNLEGLLVRLSHPLSEKCNYPIRVQTYANLISCCVIPLMGNVDVKKQMKGYFS